MLDAIFLSVREFSRGADPSHDITALVLRYDGPPVTRDKLFEILSNVKTVRPPLTLDGVMQARRPGR